MTNLDCSVRNCTYNKDDSCCRDGIHVEGMHARVTEDTSCKSFQEKTHSCCVSAVESAAKPTDVSCEVESCIYNEDCRCDAEHIGIAGRDACNSRETECASFRCK